MSVKNWVVGVVAVCIGSPFAVGALGMLGIGPGFHVEAPEWEAGYDWRYDSAIDFSFEMSGFGMVESGVMQVRGETQRVVANTTIELDDVPLYAVAEQYRPTHVRIDDKVVFDGSNASEAEASDFEWVGCELMCVGDYGFYTREHLNPFFPGHDAWESEEIHFLDFPLKRKSWTVASWTDDEHHFEDQASAIKWEIEARAVGMGYVRLPGVGAMEAVQIEAGLTKESRDSLVRALRLDAMEDMPGMDLRVDMGYDLTYWYAPEAKQIVRMDSHLYLDVRANFEGERLEAREEMRGTETLTDYKLVAGPERSLEEVQRIDRLLDELPEVRELSDVSWPFGVAASTFNVDATKGGTVQLGLLEGDATGDLIATSFDEIPAGMSVEWRHRYLVPHYENVGGEEIAAGMTARADRYKGETLELPIREQGLHEVTAYLLDKEGKLVGADSVILEGRGAWTYQGNLPVGAPGFTGIHTIDFETAMFLKQIDFHVDPGPLSQGTASWDGPEGEDGFSVSGPTPYVYDATSPESWGEWEFEYRDYARVGDLTIRVETQYDRTMDPAPYLRNAQGGGSGGSNASLAAGFLSGFPFAREDCRVLVGSCAFGSSENVVEQAAARLGVRL